MLIPQLDVLSVFLLQPFGNGLQNLEVLLARHVAPELLLGRRRRRADSDFPAPCVLLLLLLLGRGFLGRHAACTVPTSSSGNGLVLPQLLLLVLHVAFGTGADPERDDLTTDDVTAYE